MLSFELSPSEFLALEVHYANPRDANEVNWKAFEADIESVFADNNAEKAPTR